MRPMRTRIVLTLVIAACALNVEAQRRSGGTATLSISVTDPSGAPLNAVKVIVEGAATRQTRTERGRVAIEDLPTGVYRLRFELEGFVPLERELTARAGAPMDVKVTLTPAPKPPPPEPVAPRAPPPVKADPAAIDILSFLEKNFVGRGVGKVSPLTCAAGGSAVLIQMREPLEQHAHADADEFVYVVAGEGTGHVAGANHKLQAGMLLMVPRTVPHGFTARGRNPLIVVSIKAGQPCGA